jgi:hypothetical protein
MLAWLWDIFVGRFCMHIWEIQMEGEVYQRQESKRPYGRLYTLRCTKCGDLRKRRIKP